MACRISAVLRSPSLSLLHRSPSLTPLHRAMSSDVHFTEHGKAGLITLDRQGALNAINSSMVSSITSQLVEWSSRDSVEVVCIEGAGDRAFCAGGDVVSITGEREHTALDFFHAEFQMNHLIGTYTKPYVALVDGITMGGGVGLSVHGKYRVATDRTLLAMPETAIGYFPDVGGTYFLSRLPQPYGVFLGLTGHRVKGPDLLHLGIATHYVTSANLAALKAAVLSSTQDTVQGVLDSYTEEVTAPFTLQPHHDLLQHAFTADSVPQIIARLKEQGSDFALKLLSHLSRMSPRSLAITHRLLTLAPERGYAECFRAEFRAAHQVVRSGEFSEGVRALLVDKDNTPVWNPPQLEGVTEEMIEEYLTDREGDRVWEPLQRDR